MINALSSRIFGKLFLNLIKVCAPVAALGAIVYFPHPPRSNTPQTSTWVRQTTEEKAPCRDLMEFFSQVMYMPTETAKARGLEVTQLAADTWASRNLAIQIGDIITTINGISLKGNLKEFDLLTNAICSLGEGRALAVDLVRGNRIFRIRNQSAQTL